MSEREHNYVRVDRSESEHDNNSVWAGIEREKASVSALKELNL